MLYDLIIIGGGPAGLTASIYANRAGLSCAIFEKLFVGGQLANTYEVDNYPGIEAISGPDLIFKLDAHAKKFDAQVINEEVIDIDASQKIKTVTSVNGQYNAKCILITTGARPRHLDVPGEDAFSGRGVSYCATCDGAFYRGKDTAVIGGGNTAVEDAIFLSRFCNKIYLVHRRDAFRADKKMVDNLLANPKIEIIYDSVLSEIKGEGTVSAITVKNVKSNEEKHIDVSGVFIAVGTIPNAHLAEGKLKTDESGYIITDEHMATNVSGVFAAGDARNTPLRQIITAAADGAVGAYSASVYIASESF